MSSRGSTDLAPLPWEPQPDRYSGIELPSGRFVTFKPSTRCDCADCVAAREEADDAAE